MAKLKRQPSNKLQVHGSTALVRTLMKHGLVDEYCLLIHPGGLCELGDRLETTDSSAAQG